MIATGLLTQTGSWQIHRTNKPFTFMFALLTSCYFLTPRIYKTIHRPPYEIVKTEDLSSNFLSLQEIQNAYCKFKQLFLIGKNSEIFVKWRKAMLVCRVSQPWVIDKQCQAIDRSPGLRLPLRYCSCPALQVLTVATVSVVT